MPSLRRICFVLVSWLPLPWLVLGHPGSAAAAGPVRNLGPEGYAGHIAELRFLSPEDPRHLLARTTQDLWESRDGGASWRSLLAHAPFAGRLGRLAIDPFDRAHWLVPASGAEEYRPLLLETRDGGRTWSARPLTQLSFRPLVVFDDQVPNRLMLDDPFSGDFLSRDGGATWAAIPNPPGSNPASASLLAARQGLFLFSFFQDLWSFEPGTGTWRKITMAPVRIFHQLWADAAGGDTLFTRYQSDLYRSTDGGRSFTLILDGAGPYLDFQQSPRNPSHLAALTSNGLFLSLDRGSSWTTEPLATPTGASGLAFDPSNGELLFPENGSLVRRRTDGWRQAFRPRGLFSASLADFVVDAPRGRTYAVGFDGAFFRRDPAGRWQFTGNTGCQDPKRISVTPWDPERLFLTCGSQEYLVSGDAGASWTSDFFGGSNRLPNRVVFTPGDPGRAFFLAPELALTPLDSAAETFAGIVDVAVHPDPSRGLLAVNEIHDGRGALHEWTPAAGWQDIGFEFGSFEQRFLAQDPRAPEHLLAVGQYGSTSLSFDRGRTWDERGSTPQQIQSLWTALRPLFDPGDSRHLVFTGSGDFETYESTDGAASWRKILPGFYNFGAQFDPASNLHFATNDGLRMRSPATEPCAGSADNFCARQQRFELTVEWKTPNGTTGVAKKIETGSQESGVFYFFDPTNWELLVKVLDGCAINQRFWVFTAGTTDVDYLLKVEDRWTGKIRTYWNAPGEAAEAVTDIDAFATCAEPAPAGAAPQSAAISAAKATEGAPAPLELLGGRFTVEAAWTDFQGQQGPGAPAPLASANSGLFTFFSPDNWEVLIKVLDGCAINGHYWTLAAATTDVGYEIKVKEPARGRERIYSNPVGRPSPAQIDLAAFACDG